MILSETDFFANLKNSPIVLPVDFLISGSKSENAFIILLEFLTQFAVNSEFVFASVVSKRSKSVSTNS